MKIVFISPFYPYRGGISQFSDELTKEISKKHTVLKVNYKRLYPSFLFPGKSQFVENYDFDSIDFLNGIDSLNFVTTIFSALKIKKKNPEVLLSAYWMSFFSPALFCFSFFSSKKTIKIGLIHNLIPHEKRFYDSFLTKLYVNQQDGFVVLSEKVKNDILKIKPSAKIKLLFHPLYNHFGTTIDREIAENKYNVVKNKKNILFFGLIRDYKGLDLLIDAFSELPEEYQLIIAGECYGDFGKYQKLLDTKCDRSRVKHIDRFIPDEEVREIFSLADICVLPYRDATQSGVTAVSYHFEVPIIATNVGGLSELVIHDSTGVLIPAGDKTKLVDTIQSIFENDRIQTFKENIRNQNEKLSWDFFSKGVEEFVNELSFTKNISSN
jgi:glycosyltransferase involved in cell wall biosynthesis